MRRATAIAIIGAALAAFGAAAPQHAAAAPIGGHCFITNAFFDVTDVALDEHVTSHFDYAGDNGVATIDTIANGTTRWHENRTPAAQRRKYHQMMFFYDDVGQCRVGDFNQGDLDVIVPTMNWTLDGTWSAPGGQSGTCHTDKVVRRRLRGHISRLSRDTSGRVHRVGFRWNPNPVPFLDCKFQAYDQANNDYQSTGLNSYDFTYAARRRLLSKATLFHRRTITLPIDLTRTIHSSGGITDGTWGLGKVTSTLHLTGAVTLHRYKECRITPRTDLLKSRCSYP